MATDKDETIMSRGKQGIYSPSSLKEFPGEWLPAYFDFREGKYHLKEFIKHQVQWRRQDFRTEPPLDGAYHLIFCCYSLFTYYSDELQEEFLKRIHQMLLPGGYLILGKKEDLPASKDLNFHQVNPKLKIYQKIKSHQSPPI
jgi:chemotaxis methyl-accepting protein methylase